MSQPQPPYQPHQQGPQPWGPPPPLAPQDERTWSLVTHLSSLLTGFLGPLVVYLVLRERSRYVREHSAEALNMNISVAIYTIVLTTVLGVLSLVTFGLTLVLLYAVLGALGIAVLVFVVLAAVAAGQGQAFRYPLTLHLVR